MNTGAWTNEITERASLLIRQIASVQELAVASNLNEHQTEALLAPYQEILESIYVEDYPLARILDNSDFILGAEGDIIGHGTPPVSVLIRLLASARDRVGDVTKAIADVTGKRLPQRMQPTFLGTAPGSIFLGFAAPEPPENLFGIDDPLYKSVREALRVIGVVSELVSEGAGVDDVASQVTDPKARDAAIQAVYKLAPSTRSGLDSIIVGGKGMGFSPKSDSARLTAKVRPLLRQAVEAPVRGETLGTFVGTVREIDLDARRFELRRIEGFADDFSIRCYYSAEPGSQAILNSRLRVTGTVESDSKGRPRLMRPDQVEVLEVSDPAELFDEEE
jgi:hypothetical protein